MDSSEFTYHNKFANIETLVYDRVLNSLKKQDTSYNPNMPRMHDPVIKFKYKVTRGIRVIPIVEHEEDKIQWACSTSISMDSG